MNYHTIMIDPPWKYDGQGHPASVVGTDRQYGTMPFEDLLKLPVKSLAADDAHLYLWFTNSFIEEAPRLARVWGFVPKTILTWCKIQKSKGRPVAGTGFYFRGATEHILFAVRGSLRTTQKPMRCTWFALQTEGHSVKPQFFFDLAHEQSPGPRVELFARRKREGWDAWGNEVDCDVRLNEDGSQFVSVPKREFGSSAVLTDFHGNGPAPFDPVVGKALAPVTVAGSAPETVGKFTDGYTPPLPEAYRAPAQPDEE